MLLCSEGIEGNIPGPFFPCLFVINCSGNKFICVWIQICVCADAYICLCMHRCPHTHTHTHTVGVFSRDEAEYHVMHSNDESLQVVPLDQKVTLNM